MIDQEQEDLCELYRFSEEEHCEFLEKQKTVMIGYILHMRLLGDLRNHNDILLEWIIGGNSKLYRTHYVKTKFLSNPLDGSD